MRGFFIFEGTPSFLKKYQKGTPSLLIAVPQPQVILERQDLRGSVISIIVIHNNDGFFEHITSSMLLCIYKLYLQRSD